ncbi:piggybac transposable element-derived protein [Anaeramoeba flamelloides]|uniref:Piggybac transposable element-derived protein n=1 Tax=Anaeramoeba flamelloides TaxID=1746091 RepID=A0AAV7YF35_9EUKA|nr:piggybac transposable element-derived protein [Anaeramoeba flamelloides]
MSCRGDRTSYLFKDGTHKRLIKNSNSKTYYKISNNLRFIPTTYKQINKNSKTLVNIMASIGSLERKRKNHTKKPKVLLDYQQNMQFVDRADQSCSLYIVST